MIVDGEAVAVLLMHVERDSCCIKLGLVRAYRAARKQGEIGSSGRVFIKAK